MHSRMIYSNSSEPPYESSFNWNNTNQWTKQELKCTTAFQKFGAEYGWDIKEFPVAFPPPPSITNPAGGQPDRFMDLCSPTFKVANGTGFESDWAMTVIISRTDQGDEPRRCLGIYLMLIREVKPCRKIVDCSIKILSSSGDVLEIAQLNQVFDSQKNPSWGWGNYKELDMLYKERDLYLGDDNTLHIQVEMTIFGNPVSYTRSRSNMVTMVLKDQTQVTAKGHRTNMKRLLDSGILSDALIKCGPKDFPVHVNILTAQSEVFQKVFETQMSEGISRVLEVHGIEPETFSLLLEYLYTGDIQTLLSTLGSDVEKAGCMIQAADIYLLQDLKDTCFLHLIDQISDETAGTLSILSYFHTPCRTIKLGIETYCRQNWVTLSKNVNFLKCFAMRPEAFKQYASLSSEPPYFPFSDPRIRGQENHQSQFRLPFLMKMALGAYFMGLCGCILRGKSP